MSSIRERLLAVRSKLTPLTVGGVECFVRTWTEREKIEWAVMCQKLAANQGPSDVWVHCRALAMSLTDAEGNRVFDSHEQVADLPSDVIAEAFEAVCRVQRGEKDDPAKN